MIPFPDKRYNVIYADPPWTYTDKAAAGKRGAEFKYPCMTLDDIKALPVPEIAAADAVLFLWVTWPLLVEGIETLQVWGFKYKTVGFVWIKLVRRVERMINSLVNVVRFATGSNEAIENFVREFIERILFMGMGNWTRSNSEVCLMGIRGKPKRISAGVRQVIMSPIQEHSRKPDETRDRIVQLMGDVPRIELFARQTAPGWDAWGNEVPV